MERGVLITALLGVVSFTFFGYGVLKAWRRRRLLTQTPEVSLSELRPGFFRARGRLKSSNTEHQSPITNRSCAYYQLEVEERRRHGKNSYWHPLVSEERAATVEIDDGTAVATIDLTDAELRFVLDHHVSTGLFSSAPERVEEVLRERYQLSTKGMVFNKRMRIRESFLELGDELYVMGGVAYTENGFRFEDSGERFLVSDRPLSSAIWHETRLMLGWTVGGLLVIGFCAVLFLSRVG